MARRQRHLVNVGRVPGGNDQPARIRIAFDHVDQMADLIDGLAVLRRPRAPLMAVHRSEIAALVGPFVPYADAVILQIFDIGVAGQEPEQLVDDRLQMQLLGGEHREAVRQPEAHLMAEHRQRAGAGTVVLLHAVGENAFHQVEILAHGSAGSPATQDGENCPARQPGVTGLSTAPEPRRAPAPALSTGWFPTNALFRDDFVTIMLVAEGLSSAKCTGPNAEKRSR